MPEGRSRERWKATVPESQPMAAPSHGGRGPAPGGGRTAAACAVMPEGVGPMDGDGSSRAPTVRPHPDGRGSGRPSGPRHRGGRSRPGGSDADGAPMPMGGSALNSVLRSRVISVSCMRAPESPREGRCRGVMIGGRWRVALSVGSPPGRRPLLSRRGVVRSAGASGRAPRAVLRGRGAVLGRSTLFPVTGPGSSPCPMT